MENVFAIKDMPLTQLKFAQFALHFPMDSLLMVFAQSAPEIWSMMVFPHVVVQLAKLSVDLNASVSVKMMNFSILKETATLAQLIKSFQEENAFVQSATHSTVAESVLFHVLLDSLLSKELVQLAHLTQSLTLPSMAVHAPADIT